MEGKRLRVVDFRSISDGGGEGNTLWYYQDAPVRKRTERCRYQSFAFRVDTAKAEEEKADTVVNGTSLYPFSLPLINQAERRPSFRTAAFLYDKGENYELVYVIRLSLT